MNLNEDAYNSHRAGGSDLHTLHYIHIHKPTKQRDTDQVKDVLTPEQMYFLWKYSKVWFSRNKEIVSALFVKLPFMFLM